LSANPNAWSLLQQYPDRIDWSKLCKHHDIFAYDYEQMKRSNHLLKEELAKRMFHPDNMDKFEGWGVECGFDNSE
jgi:hypothetical protein